LKNINASFVPEPLWCCPDHIPATRHLSLDIGGTSGEDNRG
jgi:hypothetical protein